VLCIKGSRPPETTYFLVFDTIEFADSQEHICEALWHSARNETVVLADALTIESWDAGGAVRIIPLVTDGLDTRLVTGQTEPHWQGWSVYGRHKKSVPTAIHRWRTTGRSTMAWLLVPAPERGKWCVDTVKRIDEEAAEDLLTAVVQRSDGGRDYILRRPRSGDLPSISVGSRATRQDVAAVSVSKGGEVEAELTEGL
jgi:hypothetical protein